MKLAQRFLLAFGSVLLLVLLFYGYVTYAFGALRDRAEEQARVAQSVEAASDVSIETLEVVQLLDEYADTRDAALLQSFFARREAAARSRQRLRELTDRSAVVELLDRYEALRPARLEAAERIIEAVQAGATREQILALKQHRARLDRKALAYPREIVEIQQVALASKIAETDHFRREVVRNVAILAAAIFVLTIVVSLGASRNITQRVVPLAEMAEAVARGDFTARAPVGGTDEVTTLARAFNRMGEELQQLDTVKDEFVALASHQLRTPATAVKGNLSMLLDGYYGAMSEDQQAVIRDAYASNERQLEVIEDMLNVARAETGRLVVAKVPTDLARLVEDVVAEHRYPIRERGQTITVTRPERLDCPVDPPKIKLVVDNLVSNASKYTPAGGHIEVRLGATERQVVLEVEDSGVGIPAAARDRLFRKFSRIDNRLSVESGGTGLGLYLANEIVKLHGGEIAVESAADVGSTFSVRLPKG